MGLKRFKQINQNLHFTDNAAASIAGKNDKKSPNHDTIYKNRDFMDIAHRDFRKARAPGPNIACDEQVNGPKA